MDVLGAVALVRGVLSAVPPARAALSWLVEQGLTIEFVPYPYSNYYILSDGTVAVTNLRTILTNHRTDRAEHVIGGRVLVKKPKRLGRWETIAVLPLWQRHLDEPPDFWIPMQSSPAQHDFRAYRDGGDMTLDPKGEWGFFLALEFAGPIRSMERNFPPPPPTTSELLGGSR